MGIGSAERSPAPGSSYSAPDVRTLITARGGPPVARTTSWVASPDKTSAFTPPTKTLFRFAGCAKPLPTMVIEPAGERYPHVSSQRGLEKESDKAGSGEVVRHSAWCCRQSLLAQDPFTFFGEKSTSVAGVVCNGIGLAGLGLAVSGLA
jgi:hypothetical protein